tara:strand:- start:499 stop:1857 length:1359 start_codon:yes stop_codon:yes gene_type:complete
MSFRMIKKIFILSVFLVNYLFSFQLLSNDYMSIELQKAIDLECKKSVKNNLFDTKEECRYNIVESLNKIGIISVTRVNDEEIQNEIEEICVFAKRRGALEYNRCIHEQVYKYLGIEIIDIPLVTNQPVEKEIVEEINSKIKEESIDLEDENTDSNEKNTVIPENEIYLDEKKDSEKIITELDPDRPITVPTEIEIPKNLLQTISAKAIPSTYFVLNWVENSDKKSKIKYKVKGLGSAVAIKEDMLATACHVVTNLEYDVEGRIIGEKFSLVNVMHVNDNPKDPESWIRQLKLVGKDFKTDRCILQHDDLNAIPAPLRNYEDLNEYETIYAVGNPGGFYGKIAEGKITRLYDFPPLLSDRTRIWGEENIPIIETDAPIDKGNSGGGLFDTSGNLIGICSRCEITGGARECYDNDGNLTLSPVNVYEQCDFSCNKTQPQNWFIPISKFAELLDD